MKYAAVTSFNQAGYDTYGHKMVESFLTQVPEDISLVVYSDEPLQHNVVSDRVTFLSLAEEMPEQTDFENRHQSPICHGHFGETYDYRFDAVKFSHKPAAIVAASRRLEASDTDVLVWFDGDIIFKQPLTYEFLEEKFPEWIHVGHFARVHNHTEAGILMFRISEKNVRAFIEIFWKCYVGDQVFRLPAWTDCHVFDMLANGAKQDGFLRIQNLGDEATQVTNHPIMNSDWFPFLDHMKGNLKYGGDSQDEDIHAVNRVEVKL